MKKVKCLSLILGVCFVALSSFNRSAKPTTNTVYGVKSITYIGGGLYRWELRDLVYTSDYTCDVASQPCKVSISPWENVVCDGFGDCYIDVNPFNPPNMSTISQGIFLYEE